MDIVGLGVTVVDLLAVVAQYPKVDSKQEVLSSLIQVGGPVPTALAQLTRFGRSCKLVSLWGDDPLGELIEKNFTETGIAFSSTCRQREESTGFSQVWVEERTGRRTNVTQRPGESAFMVGDQLREQLHGCRALHLDGWPTDASLEAAQVVKAAGGRVFLDTGSPKPGIERLLPFVDVVNAPRRFVEEFISETDLSRGARALGKFGPSQVTVTDGERGAWLHANGDTIFAPALTGEQIVDTNGAGDVFMAGVIHASLMGWSPPQTLSFAVAAAGMKCCTLGNRDALPTFEAVRHRINFSE